MFKRVVLPSLVATLSACGGGGDSGGSSATTSSVDNSGNQPAITRDIGYVGGNVQLGGMKIAGEWQARKTVTRSGASNAFKTTSAYLVTNVRFEEVGFSEYWMRFDVVGGKVTSTGGWTPTGVYGVSKDGNTLVIDHYSTKYTLKIIKQDGTPCLNLSEQDTGDEYEICKVD
jgi:hypothetical protein